MRNGPPRHVCGDSSPKPEEPSHVSGAHQGVALAASALEATGPAASLDDDAAWLLPVLRIASLQAETRRHPTRGSAAVDPSAAQTQPASPAVLVLPPESRVVRAAVRGNSSCDRLTGTGRECDLGSPVREICTPGSAWGDRTKAPCRLGEATVSKGAAPARLRKGYGSETCPYQPTMREACGTSKHRQRAQPDRGPEGTLREAPSGSARGSGQDQPVQDRLGVGGGRRDRLDPPRPRTAPRGHQLGNGADSSAVHQVALSPVRRSH